MGRFESTTIRDDVMRLGKFLLLLSSISLSHLAMGEPGNKADCQLEFVRSSSAEGAVGRGAARYGLFHVSACRSQVLVDGRTAENGRFEVAPLTVTVEQKNQDGTWVAVYGLAGSYMNPSATLMIRKGADAWVWVGFFVREMENGALYRIHMSVNKGKASLNSRPFAWR